jgi:hypothetical protein
VSTDLASAVLEVESVQARNRRARHGTYHLILSFPAGEEPAADVLAAIERRACEALGFAEHQRISVVHHDTDHLHVHIAINRVHPKTHRVHWPSYSKLVLDRFCVDLEQEYGLRPDRHRTRERAAHLEAASALRVSLMSSCAEGMRQARTWAALHATAEKHGVQVQLRGNGLAFVARDGVHVRTSSVARDLSKVKLERRLGAFEASGSARHAIARAEPERPQRRAPDSERRGGIETLTGWIQRECADTFRGARSWRDLHERAAVHGLRLTLRGNGLIFVTQSGLATKASSVARDLSKAALEQRLGAFEAAPIAVPIARAEYARRTMVRDERTSQLHERYRQEREAAFEARARAIAQLRQERARDEERLTRTSQRRWAAVRVVAKGRVAWALWSAYAKQADRRDRERARRRHRAAVRAAVAHHRSAGWLEWLRTSAVRGDADALTALRSRDLRELNQKQEHGHGQRGTREPGDRAGSTRMPERPATRPGRSSRIRKPYGVWPRAGATPQALADLRGLSALAVVRFGRAPEVLLPADARRDVEQRRAEQPDRGVRRDHAQRVDDSARRQGGRRRG